MNKIFNQGNELIFASGQDSSHIRNKEQFNKTMDRLICRIWTVWCRGGLERHCEHQDLEEILECDDIPKEKWKSLIKSAYYYFENKRQENERI
jgi:hypothetical protein